MQNSKTPSECQSLPTLVFPCSGASDVGYLTDQAARQMTKDGTGRMYCLAGIGGRVQAIMDNVRSTAKLLVIDGCPQECARRTMELAGFTSFMHLRLHEAGYRKGETTVAPAAVRAVVDRGAALMLAHG